MTTAPIDPFRSQESELDRFLQGAPNPVQVSATPEATIPASLMGDKQVVQLSGKGWKLELSGVLQETTDWITVMLDKSPLLTLVPRTRLRLGTPNNPDREVSVVACVHLPVAQIITFMVKQGAITDTTPSIHGTGAAVTVDAAGEPIKDGETPTETTVPKPNVESHLE